MLYIGKAAVSQDQTRLFLTLRVFMHRHGMQHVTDAQSVHAVAEGYTAIHTVHLITQAQCKFLALPGYG